MSVRDDKYIVIWLEKLLPVAILLISLTAQIVILHCIASCSVHAYVCAVYIFPLSHDFLSVETCNLRYCFILCLQTVSHDFCFALFH